MCDKCVTGEINVEALLEDYEGKLNALVDMHAVIDKMTQRDRDFASSLWEQFQNTHSLSPKQWPWVLTLRDRVVEAEPIYGDFNAVHVMFRLSKDKLKRPKIRLMTNWQDPDPLAEHRFVQLTFDQDSKTILVHVDGWAGHGYRKFAGWIHANKIVPYKADRMTEEVRNAIQDFALDPMRCAKAMAALLGACMYCGSRLSDDVSKAVGYGPICAQHYSLPHSKEAAEEAKKLK